MKTWKPIVLGIPLVALAACSDRITPVPVIVADAMHMASTGAGPGETPLVRQTLSRGDQADSAMERCAQAAVAAVPGQLLQVGLKRSEQARIWEFGIRQADGTLYDIECSARDGRILATLQRLPSADDLRFAESAKIDPESARQIALTKRAGRIEDIRHELRSDGRPLYRYSILAADAQRYRVTVDGVSGDVLDAAPSVLEIGSL